MVNHTKFIRVEDILYSSELCKSVHRYNATFQCEFVSRAKDCHTQNNLPYLWFMYCALGIHGIPFAIFLSVLWLIILFIGLAVISNQFLCPALVVITKTLKLSENIAGVTFLALGNGAPDISSSLAGMSQKRHSLVIGQLLGGGVFVTTVVAGCICIVKPFELMKRPFLRDVIFYIIASYWIFYIYYSRKITLGHAAGLIAFYCIYILIVIVGRILHQKYKKKEKSSLYGSINNFENTIETKSMKQSNFEDEDFGGEMFRSFDLKLKSRQQKNELSSSEKLTPDAKATDENFTDKKPISWKEVLHQICPLDLSIWPQLSYTKRIFEIIKIPAFLCFNFIVPVVDYQRVNNNWCKILNTIHCITAPVFIVFASDEGNFLINGVFPLWALILIASIVLAVIVFFTSDYDYPPKYHWVFGYLGFFISLFWIYKIAEEVTVLLRAIGIVFNISDAILGLTLMAWGNGIGDLITDISAANKNLSKMGFSACFGSPLSTLLLGLGISSIVYVLKYHNDIKLEINHLIILLYGTLTFSLISTLMVMTLNKFQAKRWYGFYLILVYILFLVIAIFIEVKII